MSDSNEEVQKPAVMGGAKVSLSMADLQSLIVTAVSAATEQANTKLSSAYEQLATAILESRKPYVDPRDKQNQETMQKQMREQRERLNAQLAIDRENCPHMTGSNGLSDKQGDSAAFIWHRLDTGLVIGICTNCQKTIFSNVEADRKFFQMKTGNKMSSAGIRFFPNPQAVMERGRLVDEPVPVEK